MVGFFVFINIIKICLPGEGDKYYEEVIMNNKLFKRIVAAAASAVMLGTCAFATTLSNEAYENGILSFSYDNGAANKVTYLAYSATKIAADDTTSTVGYKDANGTKYVLGEIVAIDQIDGITANAGGTVSAKIDTSKLANKDAIILKSGDSNGTAVAPSVVSLAAPVTERTITFANVQADYATPTKKVADGTTYAAALEGVADPTKARGTSDKLDWAFVGWYTDAALSTKLDKNATVSADVTLYAKFIQVRINGDANGDGKISNTDITALKKKLSNTLSETQKKWGIGEAYNANIYYTNNGKNLNAVNGDVNGDGKISNTDITALKKKLSNTLSDTQKKWNIGEALTIVKD